jgi:asparagine synthase (glutamine-hydrolysing)
MAEPKAFADAALARDGSRRAFDMRLGPSWLVRWDTIADDRPRVLHVPAPAREATACRTRSGDLVVFDGYLFDRSSHDTDPAVSNAALVAAAYGRRPDGLVQRLAGAFAVIIWDEARRRLVVGRDAMGLTPCFYWWNGRILLVATSLDAIIARREVGATFHRAVIAEYLQNQISSHQAHETFYRNVRRLPPAHVLRLTRGALDVSRYWDPVPPGFAWASQDEIGRFDPLLEQAVDRCLSVGGDSIALSGGFDSVSVATLAAEQRRGKAPLHAVSLRFQGTVSDEGPAQVEVARALGMPQLLRTLDETLDGQSIVAAALRLSSASPSPVLSPWQSVYTGLFQSASGLGLGRLLMGTGGDDLLNVDGSYAADRLAALDLAALWRFCRACQRTSPFRASRIARGVFWDHAALPELMRLGGRVLRRVSPALLDRIRRRRHLRATPSWARPSNRDLAMVLEQRRQSAATVELARGERSYVATVRTLAQAPLLLIERDQSYAWARSVGFTFLYPYFDRDLVDLSLRIPPDELIAGGRHKAPLRRLIAARLPTVTMHAKKVDFIQALHDMLRPAGRSAWRSGGGPVMLAELGLVDVGRLDRFLDDYFDGRHASWLGAWLVLSTEAWLRARCDVSFTSDDQEAAA